MVPFIVLPLQPRIPKFIQLRHLCCYGEDNVITTDTRLDWIYSKKNQKKTQGIHLTLFQNIAAASNIFHQLVSGVFISCPEISSGKAHMDKLFFDCKLRISYVNNQLFIRNTLSKLKLKWSVDGKWHNNYIKTFWIVPCSLFIYFINWHCICRKCGHQDLYIWRKEATSLSFVRHYCHSMTHNKQMIVKCNWCQ